MLRSVLIAIKPAEVQNSLLEFAVSLSERHKAALDACTVIDVDRLAPPEPVSIGGSAYKVERDEHRFAVARQQATAALAALEAVARARGVASSGVAMEGDTPRVLAEAVQRCDLLLCGHSTDADAGERLLLQEILKQSPRPAIVVPQAASHGQGVLVAYDGSFRASRALASFVATGLGAGQIIHVLSIGEDLDVARRHADSAQAYVERHELHCSTEVMRPKGRLGDQILAEAARVSAGVLLMGAFGHSSLREFFLGSVTRSVLRSLPLPVFLDH
jgi:nucleotide-binding universal stress UspA family protein